jgi:hypothetical protein
MQDEFLGFHLACDLDLREIGLLCYVLASSENLGDALQRAARYSTIANEGISLLFHDEEDVAMTFTYVGVDRHSDRHEIESWLTSLARLCQQPTNRHLIPAHAKVIHHREEGFPELNSFFGCDVVFGADVDEVAFPGNVKDLPVVGGDPYLNELLIKYCEHALSYRRGSRSTFPSAAILGNSSTRASISAGISRPIARGFEMYTTVSTRSMTCGCHHEEAIRAARSYGC